MKIYTLHDPDTMAVRYVGFTSRTLEQRLLGHLECKRKCHKTSWVKSLAMLGKKPVVLLVESVSSENWQERERFWIKHFRETMGCNLTNTCIGGEGAIGLRHTPETREKLRLANIGKTLSDEHRAKIGASNLGKTITLETREKLRAANTGRSHSQEARKKIGAAHVGIARPDWVRAKISAAHIGKKISDESRAKMSVSHKGVPIPKEVRVKISEALTGRSFSEEHREKLSDSKKKPVVCVLSGEKFAGVEDAAKFNCVTATTVRNWIRLGSFAYIKTPEFNDERLD